MRTPVPCNRWSFDQKALRAPVMYKVDIHFLIPSSCTKIYQIPPSKPDLVLEVSVLGSQDGGYFISTLDPHIVQCRWCPRCHTRCPHYFPSLDWRYIHVYLKPGGKGRKLAWQGAWHENTKGTAQLRSFFVNVDEWVWSWSVLAKQTSRPTYWGDVCWRGRGWEHMTVCQNVCSRFCW